MKKFSKKQNEMLRYLFFGCCTFLVDSGLFFFFSLVLPLETQPRLLHACSVVSTLAAIVFAYVTNRQFVFTGRGASIKTEFLRFFLARLGTLVLAELLIEIFAVRLGFLDWVVKAGVNLLVIIFNYIFSKYWIFRSRGGKT